MKQTDGNLQILCTLSDFEMFHSIKLEQLVEIIKFVSRLELDAGEILMEEGMVSDCFYLVESGDVEVYFSVPGQKNFLEACRLLVKWHFSKMMCIPRGSWQKKLRASSKLKALRF